MDKSLKLAATLAPYMAMAKEGMTDLKKRHGIQPDIRNKPCPSTRVREEICPNCGDTHESNKHLYCSPNCFENRDQE